MTDPLVGDLFHAGTLHVAVWLRFESEADLSRAAKYLAGIWGHPEPPEPEPGRRMYAFTVPVSDDPAELAEQFGPFGEDSIPDPAHVDRAGRWSNAYALGVLRGGWVAAVLKHDADVAAVVVAVRVQAADARFPAWYQHFAQGGGEPAEVNG